MVIYYPQLQTPPWSQEFSFHWTASGLKACLNDVSCSAINSVWLLGVIWTGKPIFSSGKSHFRRISFLINMLKKKTPTTKKQNKTTKQANKQNPYRKKSLIWSPDLIGQLLQELPVSQLLTFINNRKTEYLICYSQCTAQFY